MTPPGTLMREPAFAGMFYPGDPRSLEALIDTLLSGAKGPLHGGTIAGMILPHAGYAYSGHAASLGYGLLAGKIFDRIVIVSPSHREYFDGISVFDGDGYRTPLGDLLVDEQARKELVAEDPVIAASHLGHRQEHAIEVHLPFLQKVLGDVRIVPIVMGEQKRDYCLHLARRLAEVFTGTNTLFIASSDLSHYHPYQEAESLDNVTIGDVERFDYEMLLSDLEAERTEACGGGPMVAVLAATRQLGANRAETLCHCNSGDVTGDRTSVVGYFSSVLLTRN